MSIPQARRTRFLRSLASAATLPVVAALGVAAIPAQAFGLSASVPSRVDGATTESVAKTGPDAPALGLTADEQLVRGSTVVDPDGTQHIRYNRTWKGLRVVGGDFVVAVSPKGALTDVHWNNNAKAVAVSSITPKISASAALAAGAARSLAKASSGTAEVVVWAGTGAPRLAYDVLTQGTKPDQTPSRLHTIVDAGTGAIIVSYDEVMQGTGISEYSGTVTLNTIKVGSVWQLKDSVGNYTTNLNHATSGTGALLTDADNTWGNGLPSNVQTAGVDAQYGAERTFAYFKNVLGRNGIWNTGVGARSRVHYGNAYVNAFWDGTQMTYGDGASNARPLTQLDVAGHEMTHGVTENTAALIYTGDPGGLNESTSDIFGTAVEFSANNATDKGDYLIGEKININGDGLPLRYMDRPSRDGVSPDCYSAAVAGLDPHLASGPLNHWFYMVAEGSGAKTINGVSYNSPTCNGSVIVGVTRAVAEKIWYRALSTKLTSTSSYVAARDAAIASARELYGTGSTTCARVQAAFSAIAVPPGSQNCTPAVPPVGSNLVKNPGFESGQVFWTGDVGTISNWTGAQSCRTGVRCMYEGGYGYEATETVDQMVTLPATATSIVLRYYIKISTTDEPSGAYDKIKVQLMDGNTAKTLHQWSNLNATDTYVLRTSALTAYKGKTLSLRFTMTEDASLQTSFIVDDVSITFS